MKKRKEAKLYLRCKMCNYSTHGLHDQTLVMGTGFRSRRKMFQDKDGSWLCDYCFHPMKQSNELVRKSDIQKELDKWNNLLKEEGFLDI